MNLDKKRKALIIEGDSLLVKEIGSLLQSLDFEVDRANDGETGLSMALANSYQLFIFDWRATKFSGSQLLSRLRRIPSFTYTPMIVLSGFMDKENFSPTLESFCTKIMAKPLNKELMIQNIKKLEIENSFILDLEKKIELIFSSKENLEENLKKFMEHEIKRKIVPVHIPLLISRILKEKGKFISAKNLLEFYYKHYQKSSLILSEIAECYFYLGHKEPSFKVLESYVSQNKYNFSKNFIYISLLLEKKSYKKVEDLFNNLLQLDSMDRKVINAAKAFELIKSEYNRYVASPSENELMPLVMKAGEKLKKEKYLDAINFYIQASQFFTTAKEISFCLDEVSNIYQKHHRLSEAFYWLNQASILYSGSEVKEARHKNLETLKKFLGEEAIVALRKKPPVNDKMISLTKIISIYLSLKEKDNLLSRPWLESQQEQKIDPVENLKKVN